MTKTNYEFTVVIERDEDGRHGFAEVRQRGSHVVLRDANLTAQDIVR